MESSTHPVSPLRQRMIEDMRMRKLAPKTQTAYIRAVLKFAKYLGRSPETASAEDLRHFQLHLVDQGCSPITLNATIVGLNFLFDITLATTNVIESPNSAVRRVSGRVTNYKDAEMALRWTPAGFLEAEKSFKKLRGHADLKTLINGLRPNSALLKKAA